MNLSWISTKQPVTGKMNWARSAKIGMVDKELASGDRLYHLSSLSIKRINIKSTLKPLSGSPRRGEKKGRNLGDELRNMVRPMLMDHSLTSLMNFNGVGSDAIERLRVLASLPLAGTGQRKGGEKTQPFNRLQSRLGKFRNSCSSRH